ncbi:hypothetical protein Hbut_1532 [Hyperthermus butylicus DSM 5456]|uniref:Uncharacterized protein n=1 Tax=Hyperthermus butylicus (strain DSM 5456 / JCM 9403 / PLM1-5) TaxID=415426 RepID=A2BMZ3_HYPBU|nr:hypothetical protein Hbut_1532 [Hyperthermus butylicus DSM 5456]
MVSAPLLLAAMTAYMLFVANYVQHAPQCSVTDNVVKLCVKPVNGSSLTRGWGTRIATNYIDDKRYDANIFVIWSPNPWYRVDDALRYLRSKGYNVTTEDINKLTVLFAIEVKVFKPVKTTLPFTLNDTATQGPTIVYGEERNYALDEKVLVLGNPAKGVFYALKLRNNRIIDAAKLYPVLVNYTVQREVDNSSCISLEEFVRKYHVNHTVEELRALGVPEKLCNEGITIIARYKLRPADANPDVSRIYVDLLGKDVNVLDYFYYTTYSETASIMSGAAKSVAKMTVWWAGTVPVYVRDESYCKIEWWAYLLGIWKNTECDHAAFIAPYNGIDTAHVECLGKFYYIGPLAIATFCGSAKIDVNAYSEEPCHKVCSCGELCPCSAVNSCPCRYACDPCLGCTRCTLLSHS